MPWKPGSSIFRAGILILAWAIPGAGMGADGSGVLLYHLAEHVVISSGVRQAGCRSMTFLRFHDAGTVRPDGKGRKTIELVDHPTSLVRSGGVERCFFVSSPSDPVKRMGPVGGSGVIETVDWYAPSQTAWALLLGGGRPKAVLSESGGRFPANLAVSPGNRYLVLPWILRKTPQRGKIDFAPFDTFGGTGDLAMVDLRTGKFQILVRDGTGRQLFERFKDFSRDGERFFTVVRRGDGFELVGVHLASGKVEPFATLFPGFGGGSLPWKEWFPGHGDFSVALFAISPDESRLVVTKDHYQQAARATACSVAVHHNLWIVPLDRGTVRSRRGLTGYVSDIVWSPDSSRFAVVAVNHSGCYPAYIDSSIELFGRNGDHLGTLVTERRSKITGAAWSPDGRSVAYDVYGTDLVGRLKVVEVKSRRVREVLTTQALGVAVNRTHPVTFLLTGWLPSP